MIEDRLHQHMPVSVGDVTQVAVEFRRAVGTGKDAPATNGVDVLGWDFAFELNEVAKQQAAAANIQMRFLRIPRDVMCCEPPAVRRKIPRQLLRRQAVVGDVRRLVLIIHAVAPCQTSPSSASPG